MKKENLELRNELLDLKMEMKRKLPEYSGWEEPKPKLCARTKIPVLGLGLSEIQAYWLQLSGRERKYFTLSAFISESDIDAQERSRSAFPLTVVVVSSLFWTVLKLKTGISALAQSFGFGFAQPLHECVVCWQQLRYPTAVVQCARGHKVCEPCTELQNVKCFYTDKIVQLN